MNEIRVRRLLAAASGAVTALALTLVPGGAAQAADDTVEVLVKNLDSPRGLSFGPDGTLYIAESGHGGKIKCAAPPALPGEKPEKMCFGLTGQVSTLKDGKSSVLIDGLPSAASGPFALGPHDVALTAKGDLLVTIGFSGDTAFRAKLGPKARGLGTLLTLSKKGRQVSVADLAAHETKHNPDRKDKGSMVDSYPFGVAALPGGGALVTDTGGNSVLRVGKKGGVSTEVVFHARSVAAPPLLKMPKGSKIPMQSVPMGIVAGPDGAHYVAEHGGFPNPEGMARVFRLKNGKVTTAAKGFTTVADVAFDAQGRLVVLGSVGPLPADGMSKSAVYRIESDGSRTEILKPGTLVSPLSVAVGPDGAVYVSNKAMAPGKGEVLRVPVSD
ncbi:ScyD/ScyE family protein [Streptosporangium sp. NBC_01755]|uniref:ScyD/ScyE family protein n=1 Tax=unclassified Streptosporangium TaxID=2632669 RepID=UPI002DD7CB94|nr:MULTISPECIES: ScyD/ScyE family protein [unclassified Streptosporangium]WSA29487.1 ScyD/ScyE family protein [Streptosporangium sp. NBC_01810]WSC99092.1 ScyD/ScyE family protein [Streptosporangium sp. NBC_01755]